MSRFLGYLFAYGSYLNGNTSLGFAGNTSMTGKFNTASGQLSLFSNTTGNDNTASGYNALGSNTTGNFNTAIGYYALAANVASSGNTAVGYGALTSNDANENRAVGYFALAANDSGIDNTANGYQALSSNVGGDDDTAMGDQSLKSNTTGFLNTAFGSGALQNNRTGDQNTGVGADAIFNNQTGNGLTCIGFACGAALDGLFNATAIGAHALVGQSNSLVLGGTGKYAVKVGIGTTTPSSILTIARGSGRPVSDSWETYSSRRWKTNIQTLPNALAKIEQLRGVTYDQKDSGKHEIGVIAEEVGMVLPELVTYEENGKDARGVDYARLTALLIEAVKSQREIQELRSEVHETRQIVQQMRNQESSTE